MSKNRKIILILDSSRAADRGMIQGIIEYSHLRGHWSFYRYSPLFRTPPFVKGYTDNILERLKNLDADGVIGYLPAESKILNTIISTGFPTVTIPIAEPIQGLVNASQDKAVGTVGAEHLLDRGFKHFAFCGAKDCWSRIRREGFVEKINEAGYKVRSYPLSREYKKREKELQRLAQWLKKLPKPVAIMTSNDERSADIVEACHMKTLLIPDQVAILGVDNDEMICQLSSPRLSSIKLNAKQVGYDSAEVLDSLIDGEKKPQKEIYFRPVGIAARQSTDILAIDDDEVASAVRFIRNNARRDIHVDDVLAQSTLSIRSLQQRFRKTLNRSIHQEIRSTRIRQFTEVLLKTNHAVHKIAYDMEFDDINHISRVFRKEMKMTPIEYRKRFGTS
ncbi:MAG: DNA-binding transcriptional regulator [Sedimentisphaerales bacterium]|nr:DNA-binding transcriptional regulator [Sedimentisphaerales bacterium]